MVEFSRFSPKFIKLIFLKLSISQDITALLLMVYKSAIYPTTQRIDVLDIGHDAGGGASRTKCMCVWVFFHLCAKALYGAHLMQRSKRSSQEPIHSSQTTEIKG